MTNQNLTTAEGLRDAMLEIKSLPKNQREQAYTDLTDECKMQNNNNYPSFWYSTVIVSGLLNEVMESPDADKLVIVTKRDDETDEDFFNKLFGKDRANSTQTPIVSNTKFNQQEHDEFLKWALKDIREYLDKHKDDTSK